ncbi:MAG: hypothetical protein HKN21_11365, partial [Candidatus Eisenbacteria bacterium]|nr:hypothetical protein [Candidatus Eisenbacteria bacterium]
MTLLQNRQPPLNGNRAHISRSFGSRSLGRLGILPFLLAASMVLAVHGNLHAEPEPILKRFQVPAEGEGSYNLLVIPVRFPEDRILGGGSESAIRDTLQSTNATGLRGFYSRATRNKLQIQVTLAPQVVAEQERTFYTSQGEGNFGFGTDPEAYPNNAAFLVEEVTQKLVGGVDFRDFDNTGDGFADGILLLHSGPSRLEGTTSTDRDVMASHSFTLSAPQVRGDTKIYRYAIAATTDGLGPWAHEVGHLLGLIDLYINNPFFPGDGVGAWALMATGANLPDGPAGLSAPSLMQLGIEPSVLRLGDLDFADHPTIQVFPSGESDGPYAFVLEQRDGSDQLAVPFPGTLVYAIDQTQGDNRDPFRPRVELRGAFPLGASVTLNDVSGPSLKLPTGEPSGLSLQLGNGSVSLAYTTARLLKGVSLQPPQENLGVGFLSQEIEVTWENLDEAPVTFVPQVQLAPLTDVFLRETVTGSMTLQSGESKSRRWIVEPLNAESFPSVTKQLTVQAGVEEERIAVALGRQGFDRSKFPAFQAQNGFWGYDAGEGWKLPTLPPQEIAELGSPVLTVPEKARLVLEHAWSIESEFQDIAVDAAQILLERQLASDRVLTP